MVRKNGLGKGLDSLIPSTGHKKAAPAKPEVKKEVVVEKVIKKEEVMVKITEVEPNREQPRKNLVSFSRWLSRNRMITMRSSPESGDGELQSWPA